MKTKGKGDKPMKKTLTLREHHQLFGSQSRAAEDLGVSEKTYSLWICRTIGPSWRSIKILMAKNISIQHFPD